MTETAATRCADGAARNLKTIVENYEAGNYGAHGLVLAASATIGALAATLAREDPNASYLEGFHQENMPSDGPKDRSHLLEEVIEYAFRRGVSAADGKLTALPLQSLEAWERSRESLAQEFELKTYEYRHPKMTHPWVTRELTEAGAWEFFSILWSEQGDTLPVGSTFAEGYVTER